MSIAASRVEDLFPKEVPFFHPPLPAVSAQIEPSLEKVTAVSEAYLKERESIVSFFETDADALEEFVRKFSLTGGEPKLDDLIDQAGDHLQKARAEISPQIEEALKTRKQAAVLRSLEVREVMISVIDRNLALMRRYLKAVEAIYERLVNLRDLSIQQSVSGLTQGAWSGLWDDED